MNMFLIKYHEYYTWNGRFKNSVISYNNYRGDAFKEVRNSVRRVANATQTILATPPLKS